MRTRSQLDEMFNECSMTSFMNELLNNAGNYTIYDILKKYGLVINDCGLKCCLKRRDRLYIANKLTGLVEQKFNPAEPLVYLSLGPDMLLQDLLIIGNLLLRKQYKYMCIYLINITSQQALFEFDLIISKLAFELDATIIIKPHAEYLDSCESLSTVKIDVVSAIDIEDLYRAKYSYRTFRTIDDLITLQGMLSDNGIMYITSGRHEYNYTKKSKILPWKPNVPMGPEIFGSWYGPNAKRPETESSSNTDWWPTCSIL